MVIINRLQRMWLINNSVVDKKDNNNVDDKGNDKVIIDLGANIGLVSMHLAPYADKIISVEPTPNHFDILEYFTKDIPNIYRLQGAASDKREKTSFYLLVQF